MFAVINNRGAQIGLFDTKAEANEESEYINNMPGPIFCWVIEAAADAQHEDMRSIACG